MIDRHALAREMWNELRDCPEPDGRHTMFADIAMRHIEAARAQALRQAAELCDNYGREGEWLAKEYAAETADELAARIRALIEADKKD